MSAVDRIQEPRAAAAVTGREMRQRQRLAFGAAGGALVMGTLAERLLWGTPWGIGAGLWIAALVGAAGALAWRGGIELRGDGRGFAGVAVLFAFAIAWRAAEPLAALNVVGVMLALMVAVWRARAGRLVGATVGEYGRGLVMTVAHTGGGALALLIGDVPLRSESRSASGAAGVMIRGLVLAIPILFVFGGLLASADPVFERFVSGIFAWTTEELLARLLFTAVWAWIAAGILRQVLLGPEIRGLSIAPPRLQLSMGGSEAAVMLGLLDLLLIAFVVIQIRYLFGGSGLVETVTGLTYAEYARRGFFELVAVCALALPLLLALDALVRDDDAGRRLFRTSAAALLALLMVVIASAILRMRLYQEAYGLTEQRLYATAFMGWVAISLIWFAATVMRGRVSRFAFGSLIAGFATLAVLNILNPDALIARTNLAHARSTGRLDTVYLAALGPDAAPTLLPALASGIDGALCPYLGRLERTLARTRSEGWTVWNAGRARAARELARSVEAVAAAGCGGDDDTGLEPSGGGGGGRGNVPR